MAEFAIAPLGAQSRWSLRLAPDLAKAVADLGGYRIVLEIGAAACAGARLSARLGPDEWLLCAPADEPGDLVRIAADRLGDTHHAVVDVGHRYGGFEVSGAEAPLLLAAGCPLDLHPEAFLAGRATRTLLGKAEIILWRLQDAPLYRLECARSFAPYVGAFLAEATREFV